MQAAISNKTNNEKIPNLLSKFRSTTGAKLYFDAYDKALKLWPVPFETTYAKSRFGETHVIVNSCLMWLIYWAHLTRPTN
jgi:hypothetical protein